MHRTDAEFKDGGISEQTSFHANAFDEGRAGNTARWIWIALWWTACGAMAAGRCFEGRGGGGGGRRPRTRGKRKQNRGNGVKKAPNRKAKTRNRDGKRACARA